MRALVLAVALFVLTTGAAQAAGTRYEIDADLDVAGALVTATQRTTFANASGRTLRELVFNVTPAYFGAFELRGAPAGTRREGVALTVPLATPLPPGGSATVELRYAIDVPSPGSNRLGFAGGILALGNWYPVLYPLQDGQWRVHQYTPVGDAFVTEAADYDVTLRPSRRVVVASTGQVASRDGETRRIVARDVRDFALAVSERYETASREVDGVVLTAYFLPEHRAQAAEYLDTGGEMLAWLQTRLGRYPWRTLDIAETWSNDPNQVGQEYPGIIYISSGVTVVGGEMGSYLSYLVAHEVAHQWFYGIVGDDQVREPWLDEAFATYLPERFYAERYPAIFQERWARFRARLADETARLGARPIDGGVHDYRDEGIYFAVIYRRGAAFLDELRVAMGEEPFWRALRQFVAQSSGRIARGGELIGAMRAASGVSIEPIVARYFRAPPEDARGVYYRQAGGYWVSNEGGVRFLDELRRYGGVDVVGYPASRRFEWDGFTVQVFQRVVFQWRPECGCVMFVNVFDRLNELDKDDYLLAARQTPRRSVPTNPLSALDARPAIKAAFQALPLEMNGLPTSQVQDMGNHYALRAQRVVFQEWKEDVPWARRGQVTVALGGDIAKEAGILPNAGLAPEPP
jgi:hypothetical protein